jgi:hypothetical protein
MLERKPEHVEALETDYNRAIVKSHWDIRKKKSGKQVAQLGEQKKKSISQLKVPSTTLEIAHEMMEYAIEAGLDLDQMFGQGHIPSAKLAWKYVHRQPLLPPEKMSDLQTWMRQLHEWYTKEAAKGRKMLMVRVKEEHLLYNNELVLEVEELFYLFNQDALDKALLSCYCL